MSSGKAEPHFLFLPCCPCCCGTPEPACWTGPPAMVACCKAELPLIMVPGPGCPWDTGPGGLHLESPFPNATAPTNVLVSAGLKYCLFCRNAGNKDTETQINLSELGKGIFHWRQQCNIQILSASLSSRGLFSFSSRLEHSLFKAWICFC